MRAALGRLVTSSITSPGVRQAQRKAAALSRTLRGNAPTVHYFRQADDPYSQLLDAVLPQLQARYAVQWVTHPVPPPEASAAPDLERLQAWSLRDAQRLAHSLGLQPPAGKPQAISESALAEGQRLRKRWGHYLGATLFFEGEWYWGLDRLHYLEQRLQREGWGAPAPLLAPPREVRLASTTAAEQAAQAANPAGLPAAAADARPTLHFYCSLRSPYTYLAAQRVRELAAHYGAHLQLRFVLPMVMRGLPVPLSKRLYILRDSKREAERLGLPFGRVVDPVGTPTERGLALLHRAIGLGHGSALLESFLQGVFAQGLDAGSTAGLRTIALRAGLTEQDMQSALADDSWRSVAEANRADMLARGIWGVPSFRIDEQPVLWGQDRLWMLEEDLIAAHACATTPPHTPAMPAPRR